MSLACLFTLFGALATGCASAPTMFGSSAHYSPAFEGYVIAKSDGSDDPAKNARVLLLRDPVTGNKLRCREDVVEWRELYEDVATDRAQDSNAAIAAGITGGALLGPLVVVEPIGSLAMVSAMSLGDDMYQSLRSASGKELLATGIALYKRKRFAQATVLIERALAKDPAVGTSDEGYFYLGLAYAEEGKLPRAKLALTTFLDRAGVRDVDAYRTAATRLKALGETRAPCSSTEPVDLHF